MGRRGQGLWPFTYGQTRINSDGNSNVRNYATEIVKVSLFGPIRPQPVSRSPLINLLLFLFSDSEGHVQID